MIQMQRSRLPSDLVRTKPWFLSMAMSMAMTITTLHPSTCWAQSTATEDTQTLQPILFENTCMVIKVDPTRTRIPDQWDQLESLAMVADGVEFLRTQADGKPFFASVGLPISTTRLSVVALREKTNERDAKRLSNVAESQFNMNVMVTERHIVMRPSQEKAGPERASDRPMISEAVSAVADYPVYVLIVPPDYFRSTIGQLSPELPSFLGGGPSSVLVEGMHWVAMGIDVEKSRAEIVIQSSDAAAATRFADHLPRMLKSLHNVAPPSFHVELPKDLVNPVIEKMKPQVKEDRVLLTVDGQANDKESLSLIGAIATLIHGRATTMDNRQRFRDILLGMHNYHSAYRELPSDKDGLSWRVHLLPFLKGGQELYKQFHLDEPWDSPHNRKLVEKMPDLYRPSTSELGSDQLAKGLTTVQAPVGENTVFGQDKAIRFRQIIDGLSNTLFILEVQPQRAVPWSAPKDFEFDSKNPLDGVLLDAGGMWAAATGDGASHRLRGDAPAENVVRLFERNDRKEPDLRGLK